MPHWPFGLALLLLPVSAQAQAQSYSVRVCNHSDRGKVWLAQRYYDVEAQTDVVQGWWGLDQGECSTFAHSLGRYGASTWAYYAYSATSHWAGTSEKRCIDKSTKFINPNLRQPCTGKQQLVGFTQFRVQGGAAPYSVNLGR